MVVAAPTCFASNSCSLPNIIASWGAPGAARYKPVLTSAAPKNLFATVAGTPGQDLGHKGLLMFVFLRAFNAWPTNQMVQMEMLAHATVKR